MCLRRFWPSRREARLNRTGKWIGSNRGGVRAETPGNDHHQAHRRRLVGRGPRCRLLGPGSTGLRHQGLSLGPEEIRGPEPGSWRLAAGDARTPRRDFRRAGAARRGARRRPSTASSGARTRCLPRRSRSARWPTSRNSTCAITCLRTARRRARRSRAPGTAPAHLSAFHHASVADPQPRLRDLKSESRSSATSSVTAGSTPSRAVRTSRLTPGSCR